MPDQHFNLMHSIIFLKSLKTRDSECSCKTLTSAVNRLLGVLFAIKLPFNLSFHVYMIQSSKLNIACILIRTFLYSKALNKKDTYSTNTIIIYAFIHDQTLIQFDIPHYLQLDIISLC